MFNWGNWVIQTINSAFFISGYLIFYNRGLRSILRIRKNMRTPSTYLVQLALISVTVITLLFCVAAETLNPINSETYMNWALFVLLIPLLNEDVQFAEFVIRGTIAVVYWTLTAIVINSLFYLSLANFLAVLAVIHFGKQYLNASPILNSTLAAWTATAFWMNQTQLQAVNVVMGIVMFVCMTTFTNFFWNTERVSDIERAELQRKVTFDSLTNVKSFTAFRDESVTWFELARLNRTPLTLIMFDIDHFKSVNDTHGHDAGNIVLIGVTKLVTKLISSHNELNLNFYRTGGEEFNIVANNHVAGDIVALMHEVMDAVRGATFEYEGQRISVTLSMGITEVKPSDATFDDTYKRADANLYVSKDAGRDRITLNGETQSCSGAPAKA